LRTSLDSIRKDPEVHSVLRRLGLHETVTRAGGLDADKDWDDAFSIGEQHLLSIARILLARPAFVFLDRPGSSLPKPQIAVILDMLAEQGIGVVVFAKNGESSLSYDHILEIRADGTWEVRKQAGAAQGQPHADLRDLSC
jgi:putative ATP-binding cassette transporter